MPLNSSVRPHMKRYAVPHDPATICVLNMLAGGVVSAAISISQSPSPLCFSLSLELPNGSWVVLDAPSVDLEFKFEVFTLAARLAAEPDAGEPISLSLQAPVTVTPLRTESWLDPGVPIDFPTVGSDPVMQFIGAPGAAPPTASCTCEYLGGVELVGSDGTSIVLATGSFPCSLHVSGLCEDSYFDRSSYIAWSPEA